MSMHKTGFVGSGEAELTVSTTFTDIVVGFDLGIPQCPVFMLKHPLVEADGREDMFSEMMGAITEHVVQFFRHSGVKEDLLAQLKDALDKACSELSTDDESDRSGSGGSKILDAIINLEPVDVFEIKFKLPKGLIPAIHQKVITAAAEKAGIRDTKLAAMKAAEVREALSGKPIFKPVTRSQGEMLGMLPKPSKPGQTLTQARPSLRDLIRKTRPQQGKIPTGPLFVLVYDVNGKPVGVRSIKGPGWAGISGKVAYNPASPEVQSTSLGLMMRLKQMGVRGVKLRQSPTGSFYLWFIGPASQIERKIRISDHPKLVQDNDPRALPERRTDFDIGPYTGKGMDDALEFVKTAKKDHATVNFRGQQIELDIFVDPSRSDIQRLLRKDGVCRAWVSADGQHVIAWEAGAALHATIANDYLPTVGMTSPDSRISVEIWADRSLRVTDATRSGKWAHNPQTAEVLSASPALQRALGGAPTEINYFDEDVVGPWTELVMDVKTAASFGPKDIPANFWVVLDLGLGNLGSNPQFFERSIRDLQAGVLTGVKGISDTGQIVRQFGYRGAFLRMPGWATVEANRLSRVMYGNPAYLCSKNLSALFRIWDRQPDTELGRRGVMQNLAQDVIKRLQAIVNSTAGHDLHYYGAESDAGRAWSETPTDISSPEALTRWLFAEFQRSWSENRRNAVNFTEEDIREAVMLALEGVGRIYQDEGEWLVKNQTLKIPEGSTLVVAIDPLDKPRNAVEWWQGLTPEQQAAEAARQPATWNYRDYLTAKATLQALDQLKALPFTVSFVDGPTFSARMRELISKPKAAKQKAKLFTRLSGVDHARSL